MREALTPDVVLKAYAVGLFPMAEDRNDGTLYWIDPEERGVFPLNRFHIPRRLKRSIRSEKFSITINQRFTEVVLACAESAPGRETTWINDEIIDLYTALHRAGHGHSVETWLDGALVGGLYGISLAGAFFGESMFSRETDASKTALVYLVSRLITGGFKLLDAQFVTAHLTQFGMEATDRKTYQARLSVALKHAADFSAQSADVSPTDVIQSITQTS